MLISDNHALLVDGSGGRGVSPESWARPETYKQVGFAGEMGPENLALELPRIALVAASESWVDMEGKLRPADWFDIGVARECVSLHSGFVAAMTSVPARRLRP